MKRYLPVIITLGGIFLVLIILTYWKTPKKDVLDGSIWRVENLTAQPMIMYSTLTIRFHNQKISGSSECNRLKGRYEITGDQIQITVSERTTEGCMEPEIIAQDEFFVDYLTRVRSFKRTGTDLKLFSVDGQELVDLLMMAD